MTELYKTANLTTGSYCNWFYDNDADTTMGILPNWNQQIEKRQGYR
jgi:hypothetical protein